jgi:ribosomal protein L18
VSENENDYYLLLNLIKTMKYHVLMMGCTDGRFRMIATTTNYYIIQQIINYFFHHEITAKITTLNTGCETKLNNILKNFNEITTKTW